MVRTRNHSSTVGYRIAGTAAAAVVSCGILGWLFWPNHVELNDQGYDITIALYRVCNQQSQPGLEAIEQKVDQLRQSTGATDPSVREIESIIRRARSGEWADAMRQTRRILDDQIKS